MQLYVCVCGKGGDSYWRESGVKFKFLVWNKCKKKKLYITTTATTNIIIGSSSSSISSITISVLIHPAIHYPKHLSS